MAAAPFAAASSAAADPAGDPGPHGHPHSAGASRITVSEVAVTRRGRNVTATVHWIDDLIRKPGQAGAAVAPA